MIFLNISAFKKYIVNLITAGIGTPPSKNNIMKKVLVILFTIFICFSPSILVAQRKTIDIKIINKQYIPPAKTPKIPKEFKDHGARFVVRDGDVIRICNEDKFFAKPFSLSQENRFSAISGPLRPGKCITVNVKNSTD